MPSLARRSLAIVFALLVVSVLLSPAARALVTAITETFTNTTTSQAFVSGLGFTTTGTSNPACLTAGLGGTSTIPACPTTLNPNNGGTSGSLPDLSGLGTLRLTTNQTNQASFVITSAPIPTNQGIEALFDIYSYGGATGADGIAFMVLDGTVAAPTAAGATGGSLGYAQEVGTGCCDAPGIAGGYFGVAFDDYGNFSNPTQGRVGGPGFSTRTVAIRGSAASSYAYVTGLKLPVAEVFSFPADATRPPPIDVRITVSATGIVQVDMDFTGTRTAYQSVIPAFNITTVSGQGPLPSSVRFGYAASTGAYTNFHEIRNFVATTIAPTLTLTKVHVGTGFTGNKNGVYTLTAGASLTGGPTTQSIILTDTLPTGETYVSATGTTWSCSAASQVVTCLYQGATLASGTNAPAITLTVAVAPNAPTSITNTANVNASDNTVAGGANASDTVAVTDTPYVQTYKRILSVLTKGPTPAPGATAQTVTYTPDPGSLTGVSGTATALPGYPGDVITYGLYFLNSGGVTAYGTTTALGPALSDPLSTHLTYVAASQTATCCANPSSSTSLTFTQIGQTLKWVLQSPFPPAATASAIQGSITYQATLQ
jgi:hypothetical protein